MTPAEAAKLKQVQAIIQKGGLFMTSNHAEDRMFKRKVRREDIAHAILGANQCQHQATTKKYGADTFRESWVISGGMDRAGEILKVIIAERNGILIVTVY